MKISEFRRACRRLGPGAAQARLTTHTWLVETVLLNTGCLKQYVLAPGLVWLETERNKKGRKNHGFFARESSNHQISISPHQSGDKIEVIQNLNTGSSRKFVYHDENVTQGRPINSKIEEIRLKSAFSLEGKIPIWGPDKPVN